MKKSGFGKTCDVHVIWHENNIEWTKLDMKSNAIDGRCTVN